MTAIIKDDETASDTARLFDCRGGIPSVVAAAAADGPVAPTAEATAEVVMDRRGTLNNLVIELKMERATPTPASSAAPEGRGAQGR